MSEVTDRPRDGAATRERLMDLAEQRICAVGYNQFSFRDLAAEVGIKAASVHHHYPTKGDLGAAVAARYRRRFLILLDDLRAEVEAEHDTPEATALALLRAYVDLFAVACAEETVCLCGMLAAEAASTPEAVKHEVRAFFNDNLVWLTDVFRLVGRCEVEASTLLSALEGGMITARALNEPSLLREVGERLIPSLMQPVPGTA